MEDAKQQLNPEILMKFATGHWLSKTLTVAVQFDLFSLISSGVDTIAKLKNHTQINERPLNILLTALTAMDLIEKNEEIFLNTPLAETFLVKNKPSYFGDMILMQGTRLYKLWGKLKEAVKKDKPPMDICEALRKSEETAKRFTAAMHNNAIGTAKALAKKIDLSEFNNMLDVGGGSGAYPIILTKEFPNLSATIYEYPFVGAVAEEFIKKSGTGDRVTVIEGNLFEGELPSGFDLVLLSQVLHTYGVEECKILLRKIFNRIESNGMLIINEFFLNDEKTGPLFPAVFSVMMLLESEEGSSYSNKEVSAWLKEIGFINIEYKDIAGPCSVVIARKPK